MISNKLIINKFFPIAIIALIPLLITGPLIPEVIIILAVFFYFYNFHKINIYFNTFYLGLLFYFIYLIVLSLFAEDTFLSLQSSLFYFRFFIFSIVIVYLFFNFEYFKNYLSNLIILIMLIFFIDLMITLIFGQNLLGDKITQSRFSGFFGEEKKLGSYILRIFFIFVLCQPLKNKQIWSNKFIFIFIITHILIMFAGQRGCLIQLLLFDIFLILFSIKIFSIKNAIILFTLLLTSIYIVKNNEILSNRIIDTTFYDLNIKKYLITSEIFEKNIDEIVYDIQNINPYPNHYQRIYGNSLKIFYDNYIFGIGPKMFRIACKEYDYNDSCSTHPHNMYLQLLSETGLVGTIFILGLYFYFSFNNFNNYKINVKKNDYFIISLVVFVLFFPFSTSTNIYNNWISILNFYIISLVICQNRYKKEIYD